jgi:gamma-glutamyltranspeptidase/glutathione hydrolase
VVVNVLDYGMDARATVDAPRQHHAWLPDELRLESGPATTAAADRLRAMGHKVNFAKQGDAHTIAVDPKTGAYYGAEDRRIHGKAAGY